jgi:membrane-anchored protein YejM (alkaline phosphatase superfamily)
MQDVLGHRQAEADYSSGRNLWDAAPRDFFITASYSDTAILSDSSVHILKKYGFSESKSFDYRGDGRPLSPVILKKALEEMRRFRAGEKSP